MTEYIGNAFLARNQGDDSHFNVLRDITFPQLLVLRLKRVCGDITEGESLIVIYRAKTEKCLIAIRKLPNLTARLGNFRLFRLYSVSTRTGSAILCYSVMFTVALPSTKPLLPPPNTSPRTSVLPFRVTVVLASDLLSLPPP